jgi:hypothetical protein
VAIRDAGAGSETRGWPTYDSGHPFDLILFRSAPLVYGRGLGSYGGIVSELGRQILNRLPS